MFVHRAEYWPELPANVGSFLDADRELVIEAVLSCPLGALSARFEDGVVITSSNYDPRRGLEQWLEY